ncbi:MAG: hypothetical protein HYY26_03505 [Acidobacteria bacterium]|nr:hypothetical protein [Acidobacteriota bacterium]
MVIAVLTYFFGWKVLLIVALLFGAITLGTFLYDTFFGWRSKRGNKCTKCGATNLGMFVHYGSYVLRCLDCGQADVATSFMAIESYLTGRFQAVLVDDNLNEKQLLAEGTCAEISGRVEEAAGKGNWVWLRPVGGAS